MARTFHLFTFLFAYTLFLSSGFAQNMVQWRVPEGGEAVFGSSTIKPSTINVTFSADGSQLVVAGTNGIALYDTYTGEVLARLPLLIADMVSVALSPDNRTLAGVGADAIVRVWDARTGAHRTNFIGHADPVVALVFSPDGNLLASGSFREIRLWDLTERAAPRAAVLEGHRDMVTTLAFSPDSKTLASAGFYGTVLLWDVEAGRLRHSLSAPTDSILTLAFSPDNEILASGGYWSPDGESTIRVWNQHTGRLLATFEEHTGPVFALAFSPDVRGVYGSALASAGWDTAVHIWDPRNGQLRGAFEGEAAPIIALTYLSDLHGDYGKMLASASLDGTIQVRSLEPVRTPSDVNRDGVVDILDLVFIASHFAEDSPDLNGDGVVDILDLVFVAQHLGK